MTGATLPKPRLNLENQSTARVEHPFRVVKRQFGHVKARYRGLTVGAGAGIDAQTMQGASSANILAADHIRRAAHSVLRRFMMGFKEALRC